ncbi:MAG: hypothetical protein ABSG16_14565 [Candidatus Acidiferrum sp.]|jgi:hypothetical protein
MQDRLEFFPIRLAFHHHRNRSDYLCFSTAFFLSWNINPVLEEVFLNAFRPILSVFGRKGSVQAGDSCIFLSFESLETGGEAMVSQDWIAVQQNLQSFFLEKSAILCQSIVPVCIFAIPPNRSVFLYKLRSARVPFGTVPVSS